ncbi:MAG TPA: acyl-CoA dehydrogenase family protein [Amycolatopsis sp.]|uniref:acyl-CoA dehydrogenase family protein n=1 Tax=Amycolatopsis sp. TaxID=37632 RepID=UPI002B47F9DF|nr:acyl-CoA dehydrogenase family protein [Amycolatopsis sp.]HKS47025.1 acyl-CoA dehydrogenase family protein [Amycolatopsis sp.]
MRQLDIHPTDLPEDCARLRADVRAFLREELDAGRFQPTPDAWLTGWDPGFSRALAERGWLGLSVPVEYGGGGATALQRYVVIEELLAAGAPIAAHWFSDRQIAPALLAHGTEEQKHRYLPAIARGDCFFALGMSEPDAGSDLAAVRTRAERTPDGWRVTGRKIWTSGAHHAHALLLLARTAPVGDGPRHAGMSQFLCDLPAGGVKINPIRLISGAHHFNEVVFDSLELSADALLGVEGHGWAQVTAELAYERSGPERILSTFPLLAALARNRDGLPVGETERAVLGELTARVWSLRQLSLGVAGALSRGERPDSAAALVKDLGTTFEQDVVEAVLRLVEPGSLVAHSELRRMLVHAALQSPGFTLRGGTNEILRGVVARALGMR